jgi:protein O-mannosyl-transferase
VRLLIALALVIACLLVFGQVARFDFINFDDVGYITANQWVRSGFTRAGVVWALTTIDYYYWHPLTWLSHMLDCQWFGLNPGAHHLVSLGFHIVNALLVFAVFQRLTGALWRSAILAAVFALHPLRVESVVWIAERKDLLSGFWFLAAIWCYLHYVVRPSRPRYYLVLAAFACALLSKPMTMTLPAILVLLDYWPLRRRALAEKIPMFGMAMLSSIVTSIGVSRLGSINTGSTIPLWNRLANTTVSYAKYLELSVWPQDLAILYPFRHSIPLWQIAGAALLLAGITAGAIGLHRRYPYVAVGWFWFAVGILPASGLVQVGRQGMGDRFTYLPMIGLAMAVIWGAADLLGKQRRILSAAIAVVSVTAFSIATWSYTRAWRNSVTVFAQAVAVTRENSAAQHFLAIGLDEQGRYDEALPHHAEAVRIEPSYFIAQCAYGLALERKNQPEAAIEHFRLAIHYFPDYPEAKQHLLDLSKASGLKLKEER